MYELIAMQAVVYVRYVKGIQPTNRAAGVAKIKAAYNTDEEGVETAARNANWMIARANDIVMDPIAKDNNALFRQLGELGDENPMTIRAKALATATANIGNCEAQAALAFDWLARYRETKGMRFPIEMWEIGQAGGGGEDSHVFVVIGRTPGGKDIPYKQWGNLAVVCDPWSDDSYPASELDDKAKDQHGTLYPYTHGNPGVKLLFRSESNDKWLWLAEPDHAGALVPVWGKD